jgi:hypothetical protein
MYEITVLGRVFGPKLDGDNYTRSFIICTYSSQNNTDQVEESEMSGECDTNGGREMHTNICGCYQYEMSETMSLNCGHQRAYCSSPRWYVNMESNGGMILTGKTEELGEERAPVPLCPSQIPQGQTRASEMRGRRLTAWAMHGLLYTFSRKSWLKSTTRETWA